MKRNYQQNQTNELHILKSKLEMVRSGQCEKWKYDLITDVINFLLVLYSNVCISCYLYVILLTKGSILSSHPLNELAKVTIGNYILLYELQNFWLGKLSPANWDYMKFIFLTVLIKLQRSFTFLLGRINKQRSFMWLFRTVQILIIFRETILENYTKNNFRWKRNTNHKIKNY